MKKPKKKKPKFINAIAEISVIENKLGILPYKFELSKYTWDEITGMVDWCDSNMVAGSWRLSKNYPGAMYFLNGLDLTMFTLVWAKK